MTTDDLTMDAMLLPLRGVVIVPGMMRVVSVGRETSRKSLARHLEEGHPLLLAPQRDPEQEDVRDEDLARVGVLARVLGVTQMPDGSARVLVEGLQRARVLGAVRIEQGATVVNCAPSDEVTSDPVQSAALAQEVAARFAEFMDLTGVSPQDHGVVTATADEPERLSDQASAMLELSYLDRLVMLEELDVARRLKAVLDALITNIARHRITADVNQRVQAAMDQSQREYHLKEQLKAIRAEIGDAVGGEADAEQFEIRIAESGMPEAVAEEALREVDRLRRLHNDSAEYTILRTWLETVCDIPWGGATKDKVNLAAALKVLERDHFGLDKVKERILEYLAVRKLNPDAKGPILCFVGPPGVGKTSLGRSIASALGRKFGRVALGGIKDETEIRGHRRTYVGALPGRIVRALITAGTSNPVIVLDELDKVGNDFRGDPASALLEVLDPEQNTAFVDHYIDVPVDLSQVLFIATANLTDPIPAALLDRLEIIEIPGYTEEEKVEISRRFLLPRLMKQHGLTSKHLQVDDGAIERTVRDYTREAGVRDLERQIATINRKVARKVVETTGKNKRLKVSGDDVPKYLGPPRFFQEVVERVDVPGVVIGLAWTAAGGDILFIEATRMPGTQGLKLTGSLGQVMKESVEAAMSWLRTNATRYNLTAEAFQHEFHLHVPAGAIPKDGPSAGVTMVTALASVVLGRPVKPRLAMTGEITLRGKVLPVGGVKEKCLAARRAGVATILLPRHNEKDLEDIAPELRNDLTFHLVDTVDEVLALALTEV